MGSEKLRLALSALLWLAAGVLAALADTSARMWFGMVALTVVGALISWPLTRSRAAPLPPREVVPSPNGDRLPMLQAYLEHLPVAAWLQADEQTLQPLSARARRLPAPGGVCDRDALLELLRNTQRSGSVLLNTERGSERWHLQRQPLAWNGQSQTLLVLTPMEHALELESLQAWQQLVQVLTHEIMNSLTPIKSLSQTALSIVNERDGDPELRIALDAIGRRAGSLSTFVGTYRKVAQWPAPTLAPVDLRAMFMRLEQAVRPMWTARGGIAVFDLASPSLRLVADEGQLEQALLALIQNAEQATAAQSPPRLWVQARQGRGNRLLITVRDNGPGVPAGLEQQVFLPFFSTREGGQGIGLTVVRQLMYGMGGRVRYVRPLEEGAAFVLIF